MALAHRIGGLTGWRRNGVAFACGMLATLTLAPFFIFPLIIPAFTVLFRLVSSAPKHRRAFWDGWWWGWGFYISGLYWFCIALLTDPDKFAWLIPFALFALTGVIAVYCGLACWLVSRLKLSGLTKLFAFSVVWMCVEYARGHLLSGFPWNLAGYSFSFSDVTLQLASLVGAYGLTWLAVLLGSSFAALSEKRGVVYFAAAWGVFAFGAAWGAWRLHDAPTSTVPGVMLRLVQGDIAESDKWDPKLRMQGLQEYVRLTQSPGLENVTHVIWPETAVPFILQPGSGLVRVLGNTIPPHTSLITGALRSEGTGDNWKIWNSLVDIEHDGTVAGSYDKVKLVPFGEFQPLRDFVPKSWMTPVGDKDFSRGPGFSTLRWPGLPPLLPLICYEAIFPGLPLHTAPRPQLLLNVTNDAWFGLSTGPHQHFQMSRMRAVEEGAPLVRAANTGISAVIDSYGRVVSSLPLGARGILDVKLPAAQNAYTIYARYNSIFLQLLIYITLLLIFLQKRGQKN